MCSLFKQNTNLLEEFKMAKTKKNQVEELDMDMDLELDDELELDDDLDLDLEEGEEEVEVDDDADELELELDDEEEDEEEDSEDEDEEEEDEESEEEDEDLELEDEDIELEDEDEDDEDIDLDDEDEEEEEEAPAPKKSSKGNKASKPAAKSGKATAKATGGKTKAKAPKAPTRKSYEELFEEVDAKVEAYDTVMEERANGGTAIPPSVIISKDLLLGLLSAKASEDASYLKSMIAKIMIKMGYDKEEVQEEVKKYNFSKTDAEPVLGLVTDVLYEVLAAGAGFAMFKTDDCNFSFKGTWVDEQISENKHLNTDKASKIDSYLSIKSKSPAPKNKKTLGKVVKGKFVADKAEAKPKATKKTASKGKSKKK
jgi:hypothetical protein